MAEVKEYFPHLPAYQPPQKGWLSKLPPACVPYIQLMRLDRPRGLIYFVLPHFFGAIHGALISQAQSYRLFRTSLILLSGTIFMRGATCTWNDLVDAPFDRQVERTRHRAIARGAISARQALTFAFVQSAIAGAHLIILPPETVVCTIPAIFGWIAYPLTKRVMDFPQVFLGFPMAWGVIVGSAAMSATTLEKIWNSLRNAMLTTAETSTAMASDRAQLSTCALFAANAMWTLCYETMYSYQDVIYDEKAGVRSLALLVRESAAAKAMLGSMAASTVMLFAAAGHLLGLGTDSPYFAGAVVGTSAALGMKIWKVDLREPRSCWFWFAIGGLVTGSAILSGLLAQYLVSRL